MEVTEALGSPPHRSFPFSVWLKNLSGSSRSGRGHDVFVWKLKNSTDWEALSVKPPVIRIPKKQAISATNYVVR